MMCNVVVILGLISRSQHTRVSLGTLSHSFTILEDIHSGVDPLYICSAVLEDYRTHNWSLTEGRSSSHLSKSAHRNITKYTTCVHTVAVFLYIDIYIHTVYICVIHPFDCLNYCLKTIITPHTQRGFTDLCVRCVPVCTTKPTTIYNNIQFACSAYVLLMCELIIPVW